MMTRHSRSRRAVGVVAVAIWAQACTTYAPAAARAGALAPAVGVGQRVRVRAAEPFQLGAPAGGLMAVPLCRATAVEGRVARLAGDTVLLERPGGIRLVPTTAASDDAARVGDGACRTPQFAALVPPAGAGFSVQRLSTGRTVAAVAIVSALAAAVVIASTRGSHDDDGIDPCITLCYP